MEITKIPVQTPISYRPLFALPVIVSALGFFVDVYDMLIFSIVRVPSLQSLGLSEIDVSKAGTFILNCQQAGLVIGGFCGAFWATNVGACRCCLAVSLCIR